MGMPNISRGWIGVRSAARGPRLSEHPSRVITRLASCVYAPSASRRLSLNVHPSLVADAKHFALLPACIVDVRV